jgi:hypothetical protein
MNCSTLKYNITKAFVFLALTATLGQAAYAANIVLNPGFETGDFTNWTVSSGGVQGWNVLGIGVAFGIDGPHSGSFFADSPCVGAACIDTPVSFFYQDLPTVNNQLYTLTFWYDPGVCELGCGAEELKVLWGGSPVFDFATITSAITDPGWVKATVGGLQATSATTRLEFLGRHDPAGLGVDDINVDATPEPSSLVLVGGTLLLAIRLRRRTASLLHRAN